MKQVKVNVNDIVKVKPTDHGMEILRTFREETNAMLRSYGSEELPEYKHEPDSEGYVTFQLWSFMNIFGQHIYMGGPLPFETEIIMSVKEADK